MFQNKTVIVTGGASGIGFAIAKKFLEQGAKVVLADISDSLATQSLTRLTDYKANCCFIQTDIGDTQSIINMVDNAVEKFGEISVLVNCAACFILKGLMDATFEDWQQVCKINITGYALCAKYCALSMKKIGKGAIVNIGSASGAIALPNMVTYATTKGALDSLTRCMAVDLAKYNIRVNAISPGTVWTEHTEKNFSMHRETADRDPNIGGAHILNRTQSPDEVAEVALFLASDKASFITAETIMADGGAHCYKTVKTPESIKGLE